METIQKYIELARLICKRRLWGLNGREAEQLEAWLKENPRDKSAFKNLQHIDPEGLADRYEKIGNDGIRSTDILRICHGDTGCKRYGIVSQTT